MAEFESRPAEQFLDALKHRNLEGKRTLIADLRRRQTDKAIEILIDVLQDDSWYLRELAVEALGESGEKAVPRLLELLRSGLWYTRAAAARTLGKIGHLPSIPELVALLDDSNHTVQGASLASLADFVRRGRSLQVERCFYDRGPRRAEELKRLLLAVHNDAGRQVGELLDDPALLLRGRKPAAEASPDGDAPDEAPAPPAATD